MSAMQLVRNGVAVCMIVICLGGFGSHTGATPSIGDTLPSMRGLDWSPDGQTLALDCGREVASGEWNTDIYLVSVASGQVTRITSDPATDRSPAISTDGTKIAFVSERSGYGKVHVANLNGSSVCVVPGAAGLYGSPSWESGDTHITCMYALRDACGSGDWNIVSLEYPGGKRVRYWTSQSVGEASPRWSRPASGQADILAFSRGSAQLGACISSVWLTSSSGEPLRITEGDFWDDNPCVSPDRQKVVFDSDRTPGGKDNWANRLWLADLATKGLTQLTSPPAGCSDTCPVWSVVADRIAFIRTGAQGSNVFTIKPDGTDLKQVTSYVW